jgi:hypothetical protein
MAASPPAARSESPDVATMTGSTTSGRHPFARIACAISRTSAASASIPVLRAAGGKSAAKASSWACTSDRETGSTARTPLVFWAVMATITEVPKTPNW